MRFLHSILIILGLFFYQANAHAALELLLTQGIDSALPLALVPFSGQDNAQSPDNISSVIHNDLQNSGRFKLLSNNDMTSFPHTASDIKADTWHALGTDSVVVGQVQSVGSDQYKVNFALVDVFGNAKKEASDTKNILANQTFVVSGKELRPLAHHIADIIYEKLTGLRGIFSTRIAYVVVQRQAGQAPRYQLVVADADGYNPRPILTSAEPIMSPTWSHDGKKIAYVSFEGHRSQIMISTVATGERVKVTSYPGINGAPAWSPDDRQLALTLSKDGNPKIYILTLATGQLKPLTTGMSIDTEPTWSPDGQSLVFTSDRGGSPQLYQYYFANGEVKRLTFVGDYNARALFTPDGKRIVMLHREKGLYNIAVQDLKSGNLLILTKSGRNESPTLSANGNMILYGTESGELGVVSIDGRVSLRIPGQEGSVQSPAWSPFI